MNAWTLRQQRRYDPRGNGPQNHSAARRAVRQVRRHANETGPLDTAVPPARAVGYQIGELFGGFRAALAGIGPVAGVGPRPVAWRGEITGNLYCPDHAPRKSCAPLWPRDLPDGGVCIDCGKDVLT